MSHVVGARCPMLVVSIGVRFVDVIVSGARSYVEVDRSAGLRLLGQA